MAFVAVRPPHRMMNEKPASKSNFSAGFNATAAVFGLILAYVLSVGPALAWECKRHVIYHALNTFYDSVGSLHNHTPSQGPLAA